MIPKIRVHRLFYDQRLIQSEASLVVHGYSPESIAMTDTFVSSVCHVTISDVDAKHFIDLVLVFSNVSFESRVRLVYFRCVVHLV